MPVLPEKIALRRMLHNYLVRLDEMIVEMMSAEHDLPAACRFYDDGIVVWNDQPHVFSPSTYMLLKQFFAAPAMTLSKEDVRQDVLGDDDAREGSVRQCILEARKELCRHRFPYRIETITRKGYRLVAEAE
jgi:DNA-binding winged helix-turn-helix (wHTH) protein